MEQYLRKLYYGLGSPVSYTGFSALWRKIKDDGEQKEISRADLMKWYQNNMYIRYTCLTKNLVNIEKQ